jgi:DNA-binding MarR family transcriptional regulator
MTNRVDRLVERGLVVRQSDPNDGRGVLVKLTAEGKKSVDQAISALVEIESNLLKSLPKSEQKQLADLLRVLTSSVATNQD